MPQPLEHYEAIIIGAGPGGLACAVELANNNIKTLVIERNAEVGPKVCAGGITWNSLISKLPGELIERSFCCQHIISRFQRTSIQENNPIIATVDRGKLGRYMLQQALQANANVLTSTSLQTLSQRSVEVLNTKTRKRKRYSYDSLIGADGSSSTVRRLLGVPCRKKGIGIHFVIDRDYGNMEWHLNSSIFNNGYGWIFPHRNTVSIGAYVTAGTLSPAVVKERLVLWADRNGFQVQNHKCSAGLINYDYQGWKFGRIFLIGDAAGFASALTGEGIYPAILSGKAAAHAIIDPDSPSDGINTLEKKQKLFASLVKITSRNDIISSIFAELGVLALRSKLIHFSALEMSKE